MGTFGGSEAARGGSVVRRKRKRKNIFSRDGETDGNLGSLLFCGHGKRGGGGCGGAKHTLEAICGSTVFSGAAATARFAACITHMSGNALGTSLLAGKTKKNEAYHSALEKTIMLLLFSNLNGVAFAPSPSAISIQRRLEITLASLRLLVTRLHFCRLFASPIINMAVLNC